MRQDLPDGPPSTKFPIEVVIPVRFRDIDMMGHVNNAVFITMMEQARVEYCEHTPGFEFSKLRYPPQESFILAAIQCDFKAPIPYRATVRVRCGITELGRSSFTMAYELTDAASGMVVATGSSVQVMYDYAVKRPIPMPAPLRRHIADLEGWPADDPCRMAE